MRGIIYKATNTFNGMVYIGQTIAGLTKRKSQHMHDAKNDPSNNFHIALVQYHGGFVWETIDEFHGTKEQVIHALNVAEEYHILKHNSTDPNIGYNATRGGYSSDKFADHIRKAASARHDIPPRPVLQYDTDGNLVAEFASATEAQRETGCHRKTILGYCEMDKVKLAPNSRTKYVWRYARGNHRPERINIEKPERKSKTTMEHRIIQYTLDGDLVRVWENANKAATSRADSNAFIRMMLNGKYPKHKPNYQWTHYSENHPDKIKPYSASTPTRTKRHGDPIQEIAWDGSVIATYKDAAEAAKMTGLSQSYICNIIAGRIRHPKRKFRKQQ